MLTGLSIRNIVLIEALDLDVGPGLTALTGETGAGKSIILDALGLASGQRAEAGLVRRGAAQASATAIFQPPAHHPVWSYLAEKDLATDPAEGIVLRRQLSADGRSRAFVNDQAAGVGVLRDIGTMLLEVHGQHETVGLLDPRTHRALLDTFGGLDAELATCASAWRSLRIAREAVEALRARNAQAAADAGLYTERLAELGRLDPQAGEDAALAGERALLGAAEKALGDIAAARDALGGERLSSSLGQAVRALERARDRTLQAGAGADNAVLARVTAAATAVERALVEADEAVAAVDAAAAAFDFEPGRLDRTEERLFALRALARKLAVSVDDLPSERERFAALLQGIENAADDLAAAEREAAAALATFDTACGALTAARQRAGEALAIAVTGELAPLKLDKAQFRVGLDPLPPERRSAAGAERVEFEISTNPGAPFGSLGTIASGGELARFALALKAALASRGGAGEGPTMIFDEVDQGVGGAVADAVGQRLKRLAGTGQVILVTHSPQVAARADAHWRVAKSMSGEVAATVIEVLSPAAREEEIARMLSGSAVTDAARAAARALLDPALIDA